MSTEKEYVVVVNRGVDIDAFDAELAASTGEGPIPNRAVDIANPRLGSNRMTHWMLTDEEAAELHNDPRVLSVEIPVDQRSDAKLGFRALQDANFDKPTILDAAKVNWGLRRCIESTNIYSNANTASSLYPYALDGTGVDIVIQDSGLQVDHPEFTDANGVSRVQQINWYTASGLPGTQSPNHYRDFEGHGTHCAGIATGKTYGWAKNAHVYSQKLNGLEGTGDAGTGISIADAFDTIRLWHAAKTNGRPTIVNMSWGYFAQLSGNPTGGNYRGTVWSWGTDYVNNLALWQGVGIVPPLLAGDRIFPLRVASVDAEIDDMIDAGIHVVIAAGNDYYKGDVSTGIDYNNTAVYGGLTYYYHRGSSPHSDQALIVGNSDTDVQLSGGSYLDKTSESTSRGPRVTCFAPGQNIISTCSNTTIFSAIAYPDDSNYKIAMINGTSMAAPQVVGVMAQHLQVTPFASPADIKYKIEEDSKAVMYTTNLDNDYSEFATSLMGSPNRLLYSKYGRQPTNTSGLTISGSVSLS